MSPNVTQYESSSPMVDLVLSALGETRASIGAAFYRYEPAEKLLALDGYQTSSASEVALIAESGPFELHQGGPVSRSAQALVAEYVPRLGPGSGWLRGDNLPMSAYFVPAFREERVLGVFAFYRRGEDTIPEAMRPFLELVVRIVCKGELAEESLRERARGVEACFNRFVSEMGRFGYGPSRATARGGEPAVDTSIMTPREQEVLQIFLRHGEIGAIAERLAISPHTVRNHLKAIYRKLGVHSQAELLRKLQFEMAPA